MTRAIHPQSIPGEPRAVRWVTDAVLPVGQVLHAPGTLGPLLEYGVLTKAMVERRGVWTWLAEDRTWTEHGPRIRDAVAAAVDLEGWEVTEGSGELLGMLAREVLEGELAGYVSSHGGHITVADATATTLKLNFGGACEDCPAAASTLHDRVEASVRQRYPLLTEVKRSGEHHHGGGWLGLPVPGRGR
ncbi:NifU family protein [Tessaracoccus sp. MC1756]|uniref:NifU family protein n=1 Tax=Tessaracoccus sp. MC1756 TaxID=2760311 RepID=UPI0015FF8880|nr:NifU family protein [Tessaracoccus sp. MC1756]MBB1510449.1 NifU family protein [Tessaracoccus sp. MC1756]